MVLTCPKLELGTHLFLFIFYTLPLWLLYSGRVLPVAIHGSNTFLVADEVLFGTNS